jgi:hypothetical protein
MGKGSPLTLRTPLVLLAIANLAILGLRLRPWNDVFDLPVNGTSAIDPVVILLGYIGLVYWINSIPEINYRKALASGTMFGLLAGLLLIGEVLIGTRTVGGPDTIQLALIVAAGILAGLAGWRGSRITGNPGIAIVSGVWCAMVSCLMACTTVLLKMNPSTPLPLTSDPWKQYQGLAIGTQPTQVLVHSLILATGFILIGPLVGGAVGLLFALFGPEKKS